MAVHGNFTLTHTNKTTNITQCTTIQQITTQPYHPFHHHIRPNHVPRVASTPTTTEYRPPRHDNRRDTSHPTEKSQRTTLPKNNGTGTTDDCPYTNLCSSKPTLQMPTTSSNRSHHVRTITDNPGIHLHNIHHLLSHEWDLN